MTHDTKANAISAPTIPTATCSSAPAAQARQVVCGHRRLGGRRVGGNGGQDSEDAEHQKRLDILRERRAAHDSPDHRTAKAA
jgi:hypothetical protein